jgi:hypothetical protein
MTRTGRWTDADQVSDVLDVMLRAVDAALRADPAVDDRLGDLHQWSDTHELLVAISITTTNQLGDGISGASVPSIGDLAGALLERATQFGLSSRSAVHAAACRLGVVGRNDRWALTAELRRSRAAGGADGLVDGAIALLAAVVELTAQRHGQDPELMAERLCQAALSRQRSCAPSTLNAGP